MKWVSYTLAALLCLCAGALISGLAVYYTRDVPDEPQVQRAKCVLTPASSSVYGIIYLSQVDGGGVTVTGNITGLPVGLHGFHIHTYGVANGQCAEAMGHYNPGDEHHGGPNDTNRHVGDLGNIESVADGTSTGTAVVEITDDEISLTGPRSIVGRSVVVHEGEDDLGLGGDEGSLTTGNAGARLACCAIFISP